MSQDDIIAAVAGYYEGKLAAFGTTARGVDWKDEDSQRKRFEQLLRAIGVAPGTRPFSIIDFGCGYGALLAYLIECGHSFQYVGYDCSAAMIEGARARNPCARGAVFTSEWRSVPAADYVVASGVFNVRLATPPEPWRAYVLQMLSSLDQRAVVGWAANFLTEYSDEDRKREDLYYADPGLTFDWCKRSASRWVSLFHDYDLYEFTIGIRRRPL